MINIILSLISTNRRRSGIYRKLFTLSRSPYPWSKYISWTGLFYPTVCGSFYPTSGVAFSARP